MVGGRASRGDAEDRATQAELHADLASRRTRHDLGHGKDIGSASAVQKQRPVIFLDSFPAADADADGCTNAIGVLGANDEARLLHGFRGSDDGEKAEAIECDQPFALQAMFRQRLDLAADLHLQLMQIRADNLPDRRATCLHLVPDGRGIGAKPANAADAGDNDACAHGASVRLSLRSAREQPRPCRRHS